MKMNEGWRLNSANKPTLAYSSIQNPVAKALSRQVKVEKVLAKKADESFSYHIATVALKLASVEDDEFDSTLIRSRLTAFRQTLKNGDLRAILDVEQLISLVLGIKCLDLAEKLGDDDTKLFREVMEIAETRSWLNSIDLATYVAFSTSRIERLIEEGKRAARWLNNQLADLSDRHQYSSYISALFGLSYQPQEISYTNPFDDTKMRTALDSNQVGVKELARLSIMLSNLRDAASQQLVVDVNIRLEEQVSSEFSERMSADLQSGIKEALALASSDISEDEANEILKRVDAGLSKIVEIEDGGISLHNVPVSDMPAMDTEKHALALIAISSSQRQQLYLLDKQNLHNAQQGVQMLQSGYRPVSLRFTSAVKYISTALAFLAGITLPISMTGASFQSVLEETELSIPLLFESQTLWPALSKLPLPISSILIGVWCALTFFRVMDYGFKHGSITASALIQMIPVASRIYKLFKGYKVVDGA
jgi:hypothetical protein